MNIQGLTRVEAAKRLAAFGPNTIASERRHATLRLLVHQFVSPIVFILMVATVISLITGEVRDSIIILCIIIPSGLLGFYQEFHASNTMKALLQRVSVNCSVIREGAILEVPIETIVIGDVVSLSAGNIIPADLRVLESHRLMTDESALTGEPYPIEKASNDDLFFGTNVVSGRGLAEVIHTGTETKYGELVIEMNGADSPTNFERGTRAYGVMLMWAMSILVAALVVARLFMHRPFSESLLFALALAVGMTPEMLPVIVSVSLATGARVMSKQGVIVKRLNVIQDFGAMTALCTDKTGTITAGQIKLAAAVNLNGEQDSEIERLATLNAALQQGFVNPLDQAILNCNFARDRNVTLLDEIPYSFETRRLSVKTSTGEVITKGAFHEVREVCEFVTPSAIALFEKYSAEGNRVIAIASKMTSVEDSINESGLTLRGLLVFSDPPKPDAKEAIGEIRDLGIEIFIITGDNEIVATALAKEVGVDFGGVITGENLASLTADELKMRLTTDRIFASVSPKQKKDIIQLLQSHGHTVGFFGDGINDAAALRAADVGISVDNAVDVAKSAAAIVLTTKDLRVVANGIALGRKTFVNTLKYIKVTISANFGNMLSMAISSFFLPFLPLLPSQILLLNFMSNFPDLAIATDNVDREDVRRPRIWDVKEIRDFMMIFGIVSTCFDLPVFAILLWVFHAEVDVFRTTWFVESTMTELVAMMVLRTTLPFWRSRPSKFLGGLTITLAILVVILPYTALGFALKLVPLSAMLMATVMGIIATYIIANEVTKKIYYKRHNAEHAIENAALV